MSEYVNNSTAYPSFHDISDHKHLLVSCNKDSSDSFMKPKKYLKWSRHIWNTKSSDILSYIYFFILSNELETNENSLSAEDMVDMFLDTTNSIGKEIKAIVPANLKGPAFHCPQYIKNLSHEKHIAYKDIKPLNNRSKALDILIFNSKIQ